MDLEDLPIKRIVVGVIIFLLIIIFWPIALINEGNRGLKFNMGKIENIELKPGVNFYMPIFQSVEELTIQPQVYNKDISVGNNGAITKDKQTIGAELKVFYKYKEGALVEMWSEYGVDKIQDLLESASVEAFKSVIGKYDIFTIPESREDISAAVLKIIALQMEGYPVVITTCKVLNFDWSDEFDKQIEATMKRAQEVKQKEQELLIAEQEAQKTVKVAQANRDAAKLNAEAKELEGIGIKKYNQAIQVNRSLEIELRKLEIEKLRVEKWDGQYVPNNMYGPIPVNTRGGVQGQ